MLEKTLEIPLDCKEIQPVNPKGNKAWIFTGRIDHEAPILWPPDLKNWLSKRPWCWKRLKVRGKGDDRGWDGWMASLTQWTWVWVNSGSWWRTGRPGMLQSMGSQSQTWLSDWTDNLISSKVYLNFILFYIVFLLIFLLVSTYLSYLSFKINSTVFISF